jgi:hypothetical protein
MNTSDDLAKPDRSDDESVVVSSGVPIDRVRWGPIMAGTFAALTALAILSTLGTAVGLSAYDPGDDPRRFALGAGAWGIISMLIAFFFGGWITARSSAVRGSGNGLLNGFLVGAVTIPIALFFLGTTAAASRDDLTRRPGASSGSLSDEARSASATIGGDRVVDRSNTSASADNTGNATNNRARGGDDPAIRTARRTAWGSLIGLVLALAASAVAGRLGADDNNLHHGRRDRDRDRRNPVAM